MPAPAISVIIPHLNQPDTLLRCLSALGRQNGTFNLAEILVVDNGSEALPHALCADYPNVTLLCEAERGPGPARNAGIARARGDILAFIDADCIPDSNWLSVITRSFHPRPDTGHAQAEIVGGPVRIETPGDRCLTPLEAYESIYAFRIEDYIKRRKFAGTGNMAVRREVQSAVGSFAGIEFSEDLDWGQRAHQLGFHIRFDPDMIVFHPARRDFAALTQKWDRHIAHYMTTLHGKPFPRLRTALIALSLILSPIIEVPRIATTNRVQGLNQRWRALTCLTRIRLYRARRMVTALIRQDQSALLSRWNRN